VLVWYCSQSPALDELHVYTRTFSVPVADVLNSSFPSPPVFSHPPSNVAFSWMGISCPAVNDAGSRNMVKLSWAGRVSVAVCDDVSVAVGSVTVEV